MSVLSSALSLQSIGFSLLKYGVSGYLGFQVTAKIVNEIAKRNPLVELIETPLCYLGSVCVMVIARFSFPVALAALCIAYATISLKIIRNKREADLSQQELQNGISISEDTISEIQRCMESILQPEKESGFGMKVIGFVFGKQEDVKFYKSHGNKRVFELNKSPGLIFEMRPGQNDSIRACYQNMVNAQTAVRTHQLELLLLPRAKLFTVIVQGKEYEIIAKDKLDIHSCESVLEQHFQDHADSLNEAVHQLALFICKTGYSNVTWRHNPVLDRSYNQHANRKIALLNVNEMDSSEIGLFGGNGHRGLVGCLNDEQGKIVATVAMQHRVTTSSFIGAHAQRKRELEDEHKLKKYYKTNNIVQGTEPVRLDEQLLEFPIYPQKATELKALAVTLLHAINEQIANSSPEETVKARRSIRINTNADPFYKLDDTLIDHTLSSDFYKMDAQFLNATFLGHVVKKLTDLGVIHKAVHRKGNGYLIQV